MKEILDAIAEHPWIFALLCLGICAVLATIGDIFRGPKCQCRSDDSKP